MKQNTSIFQAAVITVCVEPETAERIVEAVEKMPWAVHSSNFEAYISAVRRPYFGPQVNVANACIAIVDFEIDPAQDVDGAGCRRDGKRQFAEPDHRTGKRDRRG